MTKGLVALAFIAVLAVLFMLTRGGPRIDGAAAKAKVKAGAILVDVRSPGEYASGHIEGAVNIPLGALPERIAELGAPETEVVLYCQSGMRSGRAVGILKSKGFEKAHNLGPMSAW